MAGIVDNIRVLPGDAPNRVASLVLPTLALHAYVSEKTRDRIWAGEFVDLYALLPESALDQPDYSLTLRPGGEGGNPAVCIMPKTETFIRSFSQWSRAFQIYMSVLHVMLAPKMLKYLHVVRNISERGGNWRGYDESFRTLMRSEGWAWDCINYELWFNAVQLPSPRVPPQTGPPFLNRGTGNRPRRDCWAFNQGRCMRCPCPFRHLCRWCGGAHPGFRCPKSHVRKSTPFQRVLPKP